MISRREFLRNTTVALTAGLTLNARGQAAGAPRVVILGFDGVEPSIVEKMLEANELPNLAKLKQLGQYQRLQSSIPPQSPTAWSSFITCKTAGHHGIFDFLRRNPASYIPGFGFGLTQKAELAPDGTLVKQPSFTCYRKGTPFWVTANQQGIRCKLLNVPYAYPPDDLKDSAQLCGLEIPDIRHSQSTFYALSDAFSERENVPGGIRLPLSFQGDTATVNVPGLRSPLDRKEIEIPVTLKVDRAAGKVDVTVQGKTQAVSKGAWSDWFEWAFKVSDAYTVNAISRFHVFDAGDHVKLYMTCLQFHPKDPYTAMSSPPDYSQKLAGRYGLFPTIGWAYDTKALQKDELTEDVWLDYGYKVMQWREQLTLDEIDAGNFELLISGWTFTDRAAHMFWRFRDPKHPMYDAAQLDKYGRAIEQVYAKMDDIVGTVMAKLSEKDCLIVLSDHGFHSFRRKFSINTWLVRNGYLVVDGQTDPATAYTDAKFLWNGRSPAYDWSKTKAYALGLGSVYLNLQGRERSGAVTQTEAPALLAEIKEKLLAVTDPDTGEKVFSAIYTKDEAFQGECNADAPDIALGYAEGYQTDKSSAAGAAPKDIFSDNDDKWSGEHAAADTAITPGILFSNVNLASGAGIVDIGPTVLKHFGIDIPADFEGKALI